MLPALGPKPVASSVNDGTHVPQTPERNQPNIINQVRWRAHGGGECCDVFVVGVPLLLMRPRQTRVSRRCVFYAQKQEGGKRPRRAL